MGGTSFRISIAPWTIALWLAATACGEGGAAPASAHAPVEPSPATEPPAAPEDASAAPLSDAGEATPGEPSCFPCRDAWTCGPSGDRITLTPTPDGCLLQGLPGTRLLSPDGVVTEGGVVFGYADGTGARVRVLSPSGEVLLFCAGGGGAECEHADAGGVLDAEVEPPSP